MTAPNKAAIWRGRFSARCMHRLACHDLNRYFLDVGRLCSTADIFAQGLADNHGRDTIDICMSVAFARAYGRRSLQVSLTGLEWLLFACQLYMMMLKYSGAVVVRQQGRA